MPLSHCGRRPGGEKEPGPPELHRGGSGENKAKVLAERYSSVFGLETEYIPSYIESEEELKKLVTPRVWETGRYYSAGKWHNKTLTELVILIGAVDNNKSRSLCHRVFYQMKDLVYIDSGNGEYTGQVVCGVRSGGRTYHKPAGVLYPEILEPVFTRRKERGKIEIWKKKDGSRTLAT